MSPDLGQLDRLRIDSVRARVRVPVGGANDFPRRFEQSLRQLRIAAHNSARDNVTDQRLIFVRRLVFSVDVNAEWNEAAQMAAFGRRLLSALAGVLAKTPSTDNVAIFASPEHFLAAYMLARASSIGDKAWYFREFAGLAAMPSSLALSALARRDAPIWLRALGSLPLPDRRTVASTIGAVDLQIILSALIESAPVVSKHDDALLSNWPRLRDELPIISSCKPDALLCIVLLRSARMTNLLPITCEEATQWMLLATLIEVEPALAMPAHFASQAAQLKSLIGSNLTQKLAPWFAAPQTTASLQQIRASTTKANEWGASSDSRPARATHFGGAFLLLPFLMHGTDRLAESFKLDSAEPRLMAQFAVLSFCIGPEASEFRRDPLWRDLFQIPPQFGEKEFDEWMGASLPDEFEQVANSNMRSDDGEYLVAASSTDAPRRRLIMEAAYRTIRAFAVRLRGFQEASVRHLRSNFLNVPAVLNTLDDRLEAVLEPPPLHIVLRMTLLLGQPHALPWLDARPLVLELGRSS